MEDSFQALKLKTTGPDELRISLCLIYHRSLEAVFVVVVVLFSWFGGSQVGTSVQAWIIARVQSLPGTY